MTVISRSGVVDYKDKAIEIQQRLFRKPSAELDLEEPGHDQLPCSAEH